MDSTSALKATGFQVFELFVGHKAFLLNLLLPSPPYSRKRSNESLIPQGQIWLTALNGFDVPAGIVMYTLIKNSKSGKAGSLKNFAQQVALCQAEGYDPREVVWQPKFVKKSGAIPDENGVMQAASWYVLDFSYREPSESEYPLIESVVAILESPPQLAMLYDIDLEGTSVCVDGYSPQEVRELIAGNAPALATAK